MDKVTNDKIFLIQEFLRMNFIFFKKPSLSLFIGFLISFQLQAQTEDYFTLIYDTELFPDGSESYSGSAGPQGVVIPTNPNYTYAYYVDWNGDGDFLDTDETSPYTGTATHTYASDGVYTIHIKGLFPAIYFYAEYETTGIGGLTVANWGNNLWQTFEYAFEGMRGLEVTATDVPDLSEVTSLKSMFRQTSRGGFITDYGGQLNNWDVSTITNMSEVFSASSFNGAIGDWDVSAVTDMSYMFQYAVAFNQSLASWDVSAVTDMSSMFAEASAFNQSLASWDVSAVTDMSDMFRGASVFDQSLASWDVSAVTDMSDMFRGASVFDQSLASWDVSAVTDMSYMFQYAVAFDQSLASWDVSAVTDMSYMFREASAFDQSLASWDVSTVTDMSYMFREASAFDQSLASWDISAVTDMSYMFLGASMSVVNFDATLVGWATLDATETQIPSDISFGAGENNYCFSSNAFSELYNNYNWDIQYDQGYGTNLCEDYSYIQDADFRSYLANVHGVSFSSENDSFALLSAIEAIEAIDISALQYQGISDLSEIRIFTGLTSLNIQYSAITGLDISMLPNLTALVVQDCVNLRYLNMRNGSNSSFTAFNATNTPKLNCIQVDENYDDNENIDWTSTDIDDSFSSNNCYFTLTYNTELFPDGSESYPERAGPQGVVIPTNPNYTYAYYVDWNGDGDFLDSDETVPYTGTAKHTYPSDGVYTVHIKGLFPAIYFYAEYETTGIGGLTVANWGNNLWQTFEYAFEGMRGLEVTATDVPDLSEVTSLKSMFRQTSRGGFITDYGGQLNNWDVSTITNMSEVFSASSFNGAIGDWDVSAVTDMSYMFQYAVAFNQSLASWDVSAVTDMSSMFAEASAFNQSLASWDVSAVTDMSDMFRGASVFDQSLASWDVSAVTDMSDMFRGASVFDQSLASWDVSAVTDMSYMFQYAVAFDQSLASWDVSAVTDMSDMFYGASVFDQSLASWDVSTVTDMSYMFREASAFNQSLASWDISAVTDMSYMFLGASMSVANFDATLMGWAALDATETQIPSGISFGAGENNYCLSVGAIGNLQSNYSWTFDFDIGFGVPDCAEFGNAYIPDPVFRSYLTNEHSLSFYNDDLGFYVSPNEIVGISVLEVPHTGYNEISDLTGIEYFLGLENLKVRFTSLTTLDVSMLPNLSILNTRNCLEFESTSTRAMAILRNFTYFACDNTPKLDCIEVDENYDENPNIDWSLRDDR